MDWSSVLKAILFGIVEGITEWLPISSTGHMIILNEYVHLDVSPEFYSMFEVVIQLGAILSVVLLFWGKLNPIRLINNETSSEGIVSFANKIIVDREILTLWFKILVSCVPAAVIGILFQEKFETLFYNYVSVALALIVFGAAFLIVEKMHKGKAARVDGLSQITYPMAFYIGIFQLIAAVFPGTSRSGATIIGALLLGIARTTAAQYTFFLAVPVMFGASLLKLWKYGLNFSAQQLVILFTGMLVSFLTSMLVIQFLMNYIKKHDFTVFGWYRIALGILVLLQPLI